MERKLVIVCEGKSDFSYLNALQRFVENEIPLPSGQRDPLLRFIPYPEPLGTCTGAYDKIVSAYRKAVMDLAPCKVEIWVDADIYVRNEPLNPDSERQNGTEYAQRSPEVPVFHFSYHNFEDFIALHCDEPIFLKWKANVLQATVGDTTLSHRVWPLARASYAPLFQTVLPHYSKRRMPFGLSVPRLANLRRNLNDPDVQSMKKALCPGTAFGERLLQVFDEVYPGLIP